MASVFIVEGVPGSGKDTLVAQLVEYLDPAKRHVQVFPEEALLASWLFYFVPGIHETRLDLTSQLLRHVAESLQRDPTTVFVFNRFHVSHAVWRRELEAPLVLERRHTAVVEMLKSLPVLILQTVLDEEQVDARASHSERTEVAWQRFLERRLERHGQSSAGESYFGQQKALTEIMEADGVPHRQVRVRYGERIDIAALIGEAT